MNATRHAVQTALVVPMLLVAGCCSPDDEPLSDVRAGLALSGSHLDLQPRGGCPRIANIVGSANGKPLVLTGNGETVVNTSFQCMCAVSPEFDGVPTDGKDVSIEVSDGTATLRMDVTRYGGHVTIEPVVPAAHFSPGATLQFRVDQTPTQVQLVLDNVAVSDALGGGDTSKVYNQPALRSSGMDPSLWTFSDGLLTVRIPGDTWNPPKPIPASFGISFDYVVTRCEAVECWAGGSAGSIKTSWDPKP